MHSGREQKRRSFALGQNPGEFLLVLQRFKSRGSLAFREETRQRRTANATAADATSTASSGAPTDWARGGHRYCSCGDKTSQSPDPAASFLPASHSQIGPARTRLRSASANPPSPQPSAPRANAAPEACGRPVLGTAAHSAKPPTWAQPSYLPCKEAPRKEEQCACAFHSPLPRNLAELKSKNAQMNIISREWGSQKESRVAVRNASCPRLGTSVLNGLSRAGFIFVL